ncbi:MAG TPA: hypothetical protein VEB21_05710 [Terriglobales bacterium]|nr:hypothetical protein [Terriglobales bacterium]
MRTKLSGYLFIAGVSMSGCAAVAVEQDLSPAELARALAVQPVVKAESTTPPRPSAAILLADAPVAQPVSQPQAIVAPASRSRRDKVDWPAGAAFCAELEGLADASPHKATAYGNLADSSAACPMWRRFGSVDERRGAETGDNLNEIADVFSRKGYLVRMRFTTPSGDWTDVVDYCYRSNKTLAAVHAELRTFASDLIVERRWFYDQKGRKSDVPRQYRVLTSGEPTTSRGPRGAGYHDHPVPEYLRMDDLPWNPDWMRRELRICRAEMPDHPTSVL